MCAPVFNGQHKVGTANARANHEKQGVRKADRSDTAPGVVEGCRAERSFYERREGCLLGLLATSRRKEDILCLGLARETAGVPGCAGVCAGV